MLIVVLGVSWAVARPDEPHARSTRAGRRGGLVVTLGSSPGWSARLGPRQSALQAEQRRLRREQRRPPGPSPRSGTGSRAKLHDVIGHSVSVMTVQASAVRRRLAADAERPSARPWRRRGHRPRGLGRDAPDGAVCCAEAGAVTPTCEPPPGLDPARPAGREVPHRRAAGRRSRSPGRPSLGAGTGPARRTGSSRRG